jgi:hypothetical protein
MDSKTKGGIYAKAREISIYVFPSGVIDRGDRIDSCYNWNLRNDFLKIDFHCKRSAGNKLFYLLF